MKKVISIMLVLVLTFSLAACGKDKNNAKNTSTKSDTTETTDKTETTTPEEPKKPVSINVTTTYAGND